MTEHHLLIALACVISIGIGAQWLGWRLKLPSILPLLIFGLLAGPVAVWLFDKRLLDPDLLMGNLLFPFVSLSVGIILFEGGLSLKFSELNSIGGVVTKLLFLGAIVTWALVSFFAHLILGFTWPLSLLFGAMLIVTGPTVIIPLLRQVRPSGSLGSLLKWEGIVNDPIGAIIAVLVLEAILVGPDMAAASVTLIILKSILIAVVLGGIGCILLIFLLKRYWIPDYLQVPATLAFVAIAFAASNQIEHESGLLTVTLMGIILANQKFVSIQHIIEFKENLRVLLISVLFILLAARLSPEQISQLDWRSFLFLFVLIGVVRPATVFISTFKSNLTLKEKLFLSAIAPRGIVAAAVISVIAIDLAPLTEQAGMLVPNMFLVIIGTITFCALFANPIARKLELVNENPQGVLFVGAHKMVRLIAAEVKKQGFDVILTDTNYDNISQARMEGFTTYHGSLVSEHAIEYMNLSGIKRLMAMTSNDQANSLSGLHCIELFGRSEIYQLQPKTKHKDVIQTARHLRGRYLFKDGVDYWHLDLLKRLEKVQIKTTNITEEYTYDMFKQQYQDNCIELFVITSTNQLQPVTLNDSPEVQVKSKLLFLTEVNDD